MFQIRLMILFLFLLGVTSDTQTLRCDEQDQSSLLRFKHDLVFNSTLSPKLNTWNSTSDCCAWAGVTCRADDGHVITVKLDRQSISGGIHDSNSPLFDLHHLEILDLSYNNFNGTQIPSGIGKLVNLLRLSLDYSFFGGQIPPEISRLTSLTTLVLRDYHSFTDEPRVSLKLEKPTLSMLVRNMTRLTNLWLDGVNMSSESEGHAWGRALSSSVPHLRYLSLRDCSLSGPLHVSLLKLEALTYLDLGYNNLSSEIAEFPRSSNLTLLDLRYGGLYGKLPPSIFNMASLQALNLIGNDMLSGTLPEPIGNSRTLTVLLLGDCGFNGAIPLSMFSLPSLETLDLAGNQFNGFSVGEFPITSSLRYLSLGRNELEGPIPTSIFNLPKLESLDLSHNNFSGTFDLRELFQKPGNLSSIILSFNSLSVIESADSSVHSSFPHQFETIGLASCNLKAFPSLLTNLSLLASIDLSDNNITGEIPSWIWKPNLRILNLSHNSLTGFEGPSLNLTFLSSLRYLDLSSNLLQGRIPPALCYISGSFQPPVIDLSNNMFSGTIPPCITAMSFGVLNLKSNNFSGNIPNAFYDHCSLQTLDLSNNHFQGTVPKSMMNCKALEVVNLGNNSLHDEFPFWLMNISSLRVLVLRSNKFYGHVRYETSKQASGWSKLQIIDIAANNFSGKLPLEVFKFWTGMMGNVQPKSEKLGYGNYYQDTVVVNNKGFTVELVKILTIFTVIDFSCNHFEGSIPRSIGDLTSLYALNLSHNRFTGHIPSSFGNLEGVESLDLAHNRISGVIPGQLASLTFISYLNLSYNQLVGRIPTSTQLQSFSKWSYIGNKGLFGPPLDEVSCGSACGPPPDPTLPYVGKGINWELICVEIGYVIGLGAVIGSLFVLEKMEVLVL